MLFRSVNWSNIFPFIKDKKAEGKPKPVQISKTIIEEDEDEEDEIVVEPVKLSKPSARSAVKKKRPQMKRK